MILPSSLYLSSEFKKFSLVIGVRLVTCFNKINSYKLSRLKVSWAL